MVKYNDKIKEAREKCGKSILPEVDVSELNETEAQRAKMVLKSLIILNQDGNTNPSIEDICGLTYLSELLAKAILNRMSELKLVNVARMGNLRGRPIHVTVIGVPIGWTAEEIMATEFYQVKPKVVKTQKDESHPENNSLTTVLSKKNIHIRSEDVPAYEDFLKQLVKVECRVPELKPVLKTIENVCVDRINNAFVGCPVCGRHMNKIGSKVICTNKQCGIEFDSQKDWQTSRDMLRIMAKGMKERTA